MLSNPAPEMARKNNGGVIQTTGCLQLPVLKCIAGPLYHADRADEQVDALFEREIEKGAVRMSY